MAASRESAAFAPGAPSQVAALPVKAARRGRRLLRRPAAGDTVARFAVAGAVVVSIAGAGLAYAGSPGAWANPCPNKDESCERLEYIAGRVQLIEQKLAGSLTVSVANWPALQSVSCSNCDGEIARTVGIDPDQNTVLVGAPVSLASRQWADVASAQNATHSDLWFIAGLLTVGVVAYAITRSMWPR